MCARVDAHTMGKGERSVKREQHTPVAAQQKRSIRKTLLLSVLLIATVVILSSCYVEPDRMTEGDNALGSGGQTFQAVITSTPEATATPTPAPIQQGGDTASPTSTVDWNVQWNFGEEDPTTAPDGLPTVQPGQTAQAGLPTLGAATTGLATPTPATSTGEVETLRSGSEGQAVRQLQQRLKDLGYYSGSVDGKYGAGTVSAVQSFQGANNLSADGIAGRSTQAKLYSTSAIAKKDAPRATATPRPTSSSSSSSSSGSSSSGSSSSSSGSQYTNGRTDIYLKVGSTGAQVKILQNRLIVLGYLSGTADGDFEATTEAAVISFQKRNSIYSDGIAGPTTLAKLYSSSAKKASGVVANLGSLREGMNGSAVRSLQQKLRDLGYYSGSVDGDYGAGTQAAVMAYQSANNLTADGVAGKATLNAIYGGTNNPSGGGSSGGGSSGSTSKPENYGVTAKTTGYTTISASTSNKNNVTQLQSVLQSRNYYSGSLDGSYGGGTASAVEAYQRSAGLRVTGMAGPTTQRLLYGGTSASGSYSKLDVGSSGSSVRNLQYTLYELKYYDGDITGKYDENTRNAVMTFQQVNGLYMDGIAGQETQQKLYSSSAIPLNF